MVRRNRATRAALTETAWAGTVGNPLLLFNDSMLVDQSDLDGIAIPRNSVQLNGAALTESGNAA